MQALTEAINTSLRKVTDDLKPLDQADGIALDYVPEHFVIDPDTVLSKLERINVHKAPGPDGIPNGFCEIMRPLYTSRFVQYLMHPFEMVVCRLRCGRWLMCWQWQRSIHQCQLIMISGQYL